MAGFFQTLLRPDREEEPEKAAVAKAANLLQIGEFQVLQLAYRAWYNEELSEEESHEIFRAYMLRGEVPGWARHYARRVIELAEQDDLDDRDPRYHRYDSDYYKAGPLGGRRFALVVGCFALVTVSWLLVAYLAPSTATSVLPPYFEEEQLMPVRDDDLQGS